MSPHSFNHYIHYESTHNIIYHEEKVVSIRDVQ